MSTANPVVRDRHGECNPCFRHGDAPKKGVSREYRIWAGMKTRCTNPRQSHWELYGGRGITVCDRWLSSFEAFLADVGRAPSPRHTLDRIDNDGNYEPGNVRWATAAEQVRNSRAVKLVTVSGRTVHLAEAARMLGIHRTLLTKRIAAGMTPQEAVDRPIDRSRSRGVSRFQAARKQKVEASAEELGAEVE